LSTPFPTTYLPTNPEIQNIAKAKKEVERLDAEDSAANSVPDTPTTAHANGETKATGSIEGGSVANEVEPLKSAAADVVTDLKGASLEDKE
jgi:hypothetical protein